MYVVQKVAFEFLMYVPEDVDSFIQFYLSPMEDGKTYEVSYDILEAAIRTATINKEPIVLLGFLYDLKARLPLGKVSTIQIHLLKEPKNG